MSLVNANEPSLDIDAPAGAVADYIRLPYTRMLIPELDGSFRGEILELSGCFSIGDTPAEAYQSLETAALSWLEAAMQNGQPIPPPIDVTEFSGRLVLRLPKSLHKKAHRLAQRDGVSLNQFIVTTIAEGVGDKNSAAHTAMQNQIGYIQGAFTFFQKIVSGSSPVFVKTQPGVSSFVLVKQEQFTAIPVTG